MKLKRTVSLIIENKKGEIMLQLRDDKKSIPFPNHWTTIGGQVEKNETPKKALVREVKEELEHDLKNFNFFKKYNLSDGIEYNIFYIIGDYKIKDFKLNEGQEIKFFKESELKNLKIGFRLREIFKDYLKNRNLS